MAGDVIQDGAVTASAPAVTAEPAEPKRPGLYHARFMTMYILLGAALVATVVGVVTALETTIAPKQAWSSWKPPAGAPGTLTNEIAQHTGALYTLSSGNQMLDVIPKGLTVGLLDASGAGHMVAIGGAILREKNGKGDGLAIFSPTDTRLYQMCGTGSACAIGEGTASVERNRLVRREALQLALLTFKYVPHISHVIEFMPPPPGQQPSLAVYFDRTDLRAQLSRPLATTLNPKTPGVKTIAPAEARRIDQLTEPFVFKATFRPTQLGDAVLLLTHNY